MYCGLSSRMQGVETIPKKSFLERETICSPPGIIHQLVKLDNLTELNFFNSSEVFLYLLFVLYLP